MQEWAGIWLREQQRYWQRWARSPGPAPADPAALAVQIWQQGCELWLGSIGTRLPAELVEPVAAILRHSQEDIQRALTIAQSRRPGAEPPSRPDPLVPIQDLDLARLGNDPAWREQIKACNGFVQFHIRMIVEILTTLKAQLKEHPGTDSAAFAQHQLPRILSVYEAKLQSSGYRRVCERLINALTVQTHQS